MNLIKPSLIALLYLAGFMVFVEGALLTSFMFPTLWTYQPNPFVPQKIYRQTRNVIQFMPECAEYDTQLSYKMKNGVCVFSNMEFETTVKIVENRRVPAADGATDPSEHLQNRSCVIDFLGDSHSFGWGVEARESFAHLTAEKMGCAYRNFGVSSYGTAREYLAYSTVAKPEAAEHFIILQYSENDKSENHAFIQNGGDLSIMEKKEFIAKQKEHLQDRRYFFGKHSFVFFTAVVDNLKSMIVSQETHRSETMSEEDNFFHILKKIYELSKQAHLIVLEINGTNQNDDTFLTKVANKVAAEETTPMERVTFFDISEMLTQSDYYILDDHMNQSGHRKIADGLTDFMKGLIK